MNTAEIRINALFEELVPIEGKADTVAGEIVRAISRIAYRFYNDGDKIGVGYGNETCNPAGRYLANKCDSAVSGTIYKMWGAFSDAFYDELLETLEWEVLLFLEEHEQLKYTFNDEDMYDYFNEAEDRDYEEEWDEDLFY